MTKNSTPKLTAKCQQILRDALATGKVECQTASQGNALDRAGFIEWSRDAKSEVLTAAGIEYAKSL